MLFVLVSAANMVPVVLLKMEDSIARATLDGLASDARQVSIFYLLENKSLFLFTTFNLLLYRSVFFKDRASCFTLLLVITLRLSFPNFQIPYPLSDQTFLHSY